MEPAFLAMAAILKSLCFKFRYNENMVYEKITIVTGMCAPDSEERVMVTAHNIAAVRDVAGSYGIEYKQRGGAWKPRTNYRGIGSDKIAADEQRLGQIRWANL